MFRASLRPSSGEQECAAAYGVLHWLWWLWLCGAGTCHHNQCRTPYAAVHTLVPLMMGIMMPETCWDKSLIINIRLVASCWFLCLHPMNWMFSGTAQVFHQVCQFFFVSSVCLLVRVTIVDKNKAVVCCGIPWVNCAALRMKDDLKGQFWGMSYCLSKLRSLFSFFPRQVWRHTVKIAPFKPLNAKLNPICHLLASLGAHSVLHVSRVRVNWLHSAL